jgi:hypothetical protein
MGKLSLQTREIGGVPGAKSRTIGAMQYSRKRNDRGTRY